MVGIGLQDDLVVVGQEHVDDLDVQIDIEGIDERLKDIHDELAILDADGVM